MPTTMPKSEPFYGKMDPSWKRKWVRRLLSGKTLQATGQLRHKVLHKNKEAYAYCCLGVFCDLYDPNRWSKGRDPNEYLYSKSTYGRELTFVPKPLMKKVGLSEQASLFLTHANDAKGWSFKRIGKWIDKNL